MKALLGKIFGSLGEGKIGLMMMAISFAVFFAHFSFIEALSEKIFDLNFQFRGDIAGKRDVVIIAIDQKSQEKLGRWPWSRSVMAELIGKLSSFTPRVIGLDIVFSYPEERPDLKLAQSVLGMLKQRPSYDEELYREVEKTAIKADVDTRLAEVIKKAGNVVPGYFFLTLQEEVETLGLDNKADYRIIRKHRYKRIKYPKDGRRDFITKEALGVKPNIKILTDAARYTGYFNIFPENDGVTRRFVNTVKFNGKYFVPAVIQMLRVWYDDDKAKLEFEEYGITGIKVGPRFIPTDEFGRTFINYYGPEGKFKRISVSDVIEGSLSDEEFYSLFHDKIVIVGATAMGIYDIRHTPFGSMAGVEVEASFIQNVIDDIVLQKPGWFFIFDAGSILALGILLIIAMKRLRPMGGAVMAVLLALGYVFFQRYVFVEKYILLDILYPIISIILVYGGIALYKYYVEYRERRYIQNAFQFYLSPSVISKMLDDPEALKLGGEERELSALFSDIQSFSSFSEKMVPAELVKLLNDYLSEMSDLIMENEGTVDKYIGDAIVAFFGAPLHYPDHAVKACRSALLCHRKLEKLRGEWESRGKPPIYARIGINTGKMLVGNMGSRQRFDYTIMGDEVNLASRLEGVNKQYGTFICISGRTCDQIKGDFEVRELDLIRVMGRTTPERIFELLSYKGELTAEREKWLILWQEAFSLYKSWKWKEAIEAFEATRKLNGEDVASAKFIERCGKYLATPPAEDWDGVFTLTTK